MAKKLVKSATRNQGFGLPL